jgi:hypothetical protein
MIHRRPSGGRNRFLAAASALSFIAACGMAGPAAAQPPVPDDPVAALREEIAALRQSYESRLADLEKRLAEIEAGRGTASPPPDAATAVPAPAPPGSEDAELAALAAEAAGAAGPAGEPAAAVPEGGAAEAAPAAAPREAVFGSERNLSRLNPEISMTGDFVGVASDRDREDFRAREFELNVQSALDPYSFTKWTLSFAPGGEVDVEEGYVGYNGLPGGLTLLAGRFRQSFGALNRWHLHALPQLDYPLALQAYFGEEGLDQTGLSLSWLVPRPWATANELTFELTDGRNEAFGGEDFQHLAALAHLKNYWDLGSAVYAELGLSGVAGTDGHGGRSRVYGTDLTLHWQPPQRAKYREVTWRTELLRSERGDPARLDRRAVNAWGGYSYVESLVAQNVYAGLRYDRVEDPFDPGHVRWGLVPNLTWWQSEFVRLRGEYTYLKDSFLDRAENRFSLQITWAAGPHKHETY